MMAGSTTRRSSSSKRRSISARRSNMAARHAAEASAGGLFSALAVLAVETLDAARRVDQLLLAGEERVTRRADLDVDGIGGRARLDDIATGTHDTNGLVARMNTLFHGEGRVCNTGPLPVQIGGAWVCGRAVHFAMRPQSQG